MMPERKCLANGRQVAEGRGIRVVRPGREWHIELCCSEFCAARAKVAEEGRT